MGLALVDEEFVKYFYTTVFLLILLGFVVYKFDMTIDEFNEERQEYKTTLRSERMKIERLEIRFNEFKYYHDDTRARVKKYLPEL